MEAALSPDTAELSWHCGRPWACWRDAADGGIIGWLGSPGTGRRSATWSSTALWKGAGSGAERCGTAASGPALAQATDGAMSCMAALAAIAATSDRPALNTAPVSGDSSADGLTTGPSRAKAEGAIGDCSSQAPLLEQGARSQLAVCGAAEFEGGRRF